MSEKRSLLLLFVMFVSVLGAALAHVSLRLGVIHEGYALNEASREHQRLSDENKKLLLERASLRSPERVQNAALKLQMATPSPSNIRVIKVPPP